MVAPRPRHGDTDVGAGRARISLLNLLWRREDSLPPAAASLDCMHGCAWTRAPHTSLLTPYHTSHMMRREHEGLSKQDHLNHMLHVGVRRGSETRSLHSPLSLMFMRKF